MASKVHTEWLSGNCPVQAEGHVRGMPFYFRARGHGWSLELNDGEQTVACITCRYGPSYSAGWMPHEDARAIIDAVAPSLLPVLDLPNRRGEPERPLDPKVAEQYAAINAMVDKSRAEQTLAEDNAALRIRVAELEAKVREAKNGR